MDEESEPVRPEGKRFIMQWSRSPAVFRQYGGRSDCQHPGLVEGVCKWPEEAWSVFACQACGGTIHGWRWGRKVL